MVILLFIYFIINVVFFPFWNLILVLTFVKFSSFSVYLLKVRYLASIIILVFLLMYIFFSEIILNRKTKIENFILIVAALYIFLLFAANLLFFPNLNISYIDKIVVIFSNLIIIFLIFAPFADINTKVKLNVLERLVKIYLGVGLFVILIGFIEKLFISDEFLTSLHYNQLIGMAKGLDSLRTYSHPVPDNLFTMVENFRVRRMISIIGEPLYFAYYIYPIVFVFFVYFFLRRNLLSFFIFIISFLALLLAISRNMYIAFFISIFLFLIRNSKYKKIFLFSFALLIAISLPIFFYIAPILYKKDESFRGHIDSFIYFCKYIGIKGVFLPSFETMINNLLQVKFSFSNFIAESSFLIIVSNLGLLGLFGIIYYLIQTVSHMKSINNYTYMNLYLNLYVVSFPYILIGYISSIIFSPHILTFQIANYIIGLSLIYILSKKTLECGYIK